jgi:hypothetical protein
LTQARGDEYPCMGVVDGAFKPPTEGIRLKETELLRSRP